MSEATNNPNARRDAADERSEQASSNTPSTEVLITAALIANNLGYIKVSGKWFYIAEWVYPAIDEGGTLQPVFEAKPISGVEGLGILQAYKQVWTNYSRS